MADRRIIVYQTNSLTGEPAETETAPSPAPAPAVDSPILLQTTSDLTDWAV